ncbi:MAG: divergent polysaccharide deacetylase family protein [Gammaproteobacteria bacterium]|nr:divergent polysaccharide deacetylase family protein [Gammaproteobacteria bacterium]
MGGHLDAARRVLQLPGPVACSFLPLAPYTRQLAQEAYVQNKEVLLHLPMQTMRDRPLDAGGLTLDMSEAVFLQVLREDIAKVPHVSGINNHMGSLLTQHPGHMTWLMQEMGRQQALFFIDSRTTHSSIAYNIAQENNIPSAKRDVFLDDERDVVLIEKQFDRLLDLARKNGHAIAIGHPYPETLAVLERRLSQLSKKIRLVPLNKLLLMHEVADLEEQKKWQTSLYPSHRAVKN